MRDGLQRAPLDRMCFMARLVRANSPFTTSMMVKRFEVSPRTISRDLEFMRDRLGYTITYDQSLPGYVGDAPEAVL